MKTNTTSSTSSAKIHRIITACIRILLGLVFFVFGLNGFFHFIPSPPTMPEFAMALLKTGYMFPMVAGTQVVAGGLLLANRFVPLALAILAPVVVNIVAFHVFLEASGTSIAVVVLLFELYLAWAYRRAYFSMLAPRVTPE